MPGGECFQGLDTCCILCTYLNAIMVWSMPPCARNPPQDRPLQHKSPLVPNPTLQEHHLLSTSLPSSETPSGGTAFRNLFIFVSADRSDLCSSLFPLDVNSSCKICQERETQLPIIGSMPTLPAADMSLKFSQAVKCSPVSKLRNWGQLQQVTEVTCRSNKTDFYGKV